MDYKDESLCNKSGGIKMIKKEYKTLVDKDEVEFDKKIEKHLSEGWSLYGESKFEIFTTWNPLISNCILCFQTITRDKEGS